MKKFIAKYKEDIPTTLLFLVACGIPTYTAFKTGEIVIGVLLGVSTIVVCVLGLMVINHD